MTGVVSITKGLKNNSLYLGLLRRFKKNIQQVKINILKKQEKIVFHPMKCPQSLDKKFIQHMKAL